MSDQHLASFSRDAILPAHQAHHSLPNVQESSSINTSIEPSPREEEAGDADAMHTFSQ